MEGKELNNTSAGEKKTRQPFNSTARRFTAMTAKYIEQLERTKRYLKRFSDINTGIIHTQASPNYDDDVYAFFQNCYHLKDWIKNDPYCSKWGKVEKFIDSNNDLRTCADLCNGLKHLKLTKQRRPTENPQFSGRQISLNIREGGSDSSEVGIAISYMIETASGDIDAFDLARKCVSAWENYIANNIPLSNLALNVDAAHDTAQHRLR